MPRNPFEPPYDQFLTTATAIAQSRPDVDLDTAREIFEEAATLLHNGLVLDGLDEHDARTVVAGLCIDLVATDPGAAIRARAAAVAGGADDLHDAEEARAALLTTVALFRL
jgi:hypothetical protein